MIIVQLACIYIHTQEAVGGRVMTTKTHTYTRPCSPLIFRVHKHTHTQVATCLLEIWLMMTHTYRPMPTVDCLHKHIFLLHVYRSDFLARMRRYTQLTYLFHQCAASPLIRDGRIADCTVRHPGVERPFSSLKSA